MSFVFVDWDDQLHTRECGCPAGAGGTREAAVAWWETPGAPESHQPPEHQHLLLVLVSPSGAQPIYTTWCLSSNSWGSTGSLLHISWQQLWGATQSAPCCPNLHEILAMPWQQNNKLLAPGLKSQKTARGAVGRGQKTQEGGLLARWDGDEKKKGTEHWWDEFCKDQNHLLSWAETNNVCIFHKKKTSQQQLIDHGVYSILLQLHFPYLKFDKMEMSSFKAWDWQCNGRNAWNAKLWTRLSPPPDTNWLIFMRKVCVLLINNLCCNFNPISFLIALSQFHVAILAIEKWVRSV